MIIWLLALALAAEGPLIELKGPRSPEGRAEDRQVPADLSKVPYPATVVHAAAQLGLSRDFVHHVQKGLELLYERRYAETRQFFTELETVFPHTAVSAVGDLLVWQAVMLENFDFRYDDQYRAASQLARAKLSEAAKLKGNEAWEHLMLGVVAGIEAIHAARQSRYLPALSLAFEAIDQIEATRTLAPSFVDLDLADGLYNYWRTALTQQAKGLPSFGDKRQQGIEEIQAVIDRGVFLAAPARLAMAFTWMEEQKHDRARDVLLANRASYPKNIINEMMLGVAFLSLKDNAAALATFDGVLAIDPKNRRVHYYRAVALLRSGRTADAIVELKGYLALPDIEVWQRSGAYFRLGQALEEQKAWPGAMAAFEKAVALDGSAGAKAGVERLKRLKKEGKIDF